MNGIIIRLYAILILLLTGCSYGSEGYMIEGKIKGEGESLSREKIYMQIAGTKGVIYDSAELRNGKFKFRGKLDSPERMLLFVKGLPYNIPICLENAKYNINAESGSLRDAKISGGESQELFNKLNTKSKKVMERYNLNEILSEYLNADTDSVRKGRLNAILSTANSEMKRFNDSLIESAPDSFFSLLNLYETANVEEFSVVCKRLNFFEKKSLYSDNRFLISIKETIKRREALLAGKEAPNLALTSYSGQTLYLNDITRKNRLTILLFWASWNKESIQMCRRYQSVYKKGKYKDAEIVAVSINDSENNWREIIKKEKIDWINMIDNGYREAMLKYNVNLIPKVFLIDDQNRIVMSDFRFEDLELFINSKSLR